MKAFAYLRVSGIGQVDGDGFDRQRQAIERQSIAMGATISKEFAEEGVTGEADWSDRPAFRDMMAAVMDNGVRTIIVENLTRLARSYVIQDAILIYLASKNVSLISADTGENITEAFLGDPMKKAIIQMQAVFSELEKNSLVRKLNAARSRKREKVGRCEGVKPFGTFPGEPETIERMRQLRRKAPGSKRASFARIAEVLQAEGYQTRSGKPWAASSVRDILAKHSPTKRP